MNNANDELQKLKYERDIIDAAISKNRTELKKFKTVTILVAGRKIGFGALVNTMVDLLDNGDTYEMGLQRISKYAEIRSQNSTIVSAASDRDTFHTEFVKRWHHEQTHLGSQGGTAPGKNNPVNSENIPMLGAECKNSCGVFWYDGVHYEYYSGFSGGIPAFLGSIPGLAKSSHRSTCKGTASCGDGYWTCEGTESGGTARHQLRTCKIQGLQWNSGTSSYDRVTCNMAYRNCDNPGGRCFNGSSAGNQPHNDNPPLVTDNTPNCSGCTSHCSSPCSCSTFGTCNGTVSTPSYHACGEHETSVSGDHSLQSSCSSTDANGNSCTVTSFYACDNHSHTYPAPPPPTTVACDGASYTGCSGAPSRTAHYVPSCSNCRNDYWTCSQWAYRHTETKPCKRSGCDASPTPCQNGPRACVRPGKPANWHWL